MGQPKDKNIENEDIIPELFCIKYSGIKYEFYIWKNGLNGTNFRIQKLVQLKNQVVLIHFFHSEGWHKGIELAFSIFIWWMHSTNQKYFMSPS